MSTRSLDSQRTAEFVRLYTTHSRRVYTYLLTLLPQRTDAEDVFQDVGALLWEKFGEFTLGTNFAAWACKIAQFQALKFTLSSARRNKLFNSAVLESLESELTATEGSFDGEYQALADCFAKLTAADRNLIERRYRADSSPRSLAAEMKLPVQQLYRTLARIRRNLLKCVTLRLAKDG